MPVAPRAIRIYILITSAAALLFAGAVAAGSNPHVSPPWLVAALLVAAVVAGKFRLHITDKTKVYVDTSVFAMTVLTLRPVPAMVVAAVALVVQGLVAREHWEQALFNVAQTVLYVGSGALAFRAVSSEHGRSFPHATFVGLGVLTAVVVMHALNTALVAGLVALQLSQPPMRTWLEGLTIDLPEHIALTITGILAAALLGRAAWLVPLLAAPVAVVYASLRTALEFRAASSDLAAAASRVAGLLDATAPEPPSHVADRPGRLSLQREGTAFAP